MKMSSSIDFFPPVDPSKTPDKPDPTDDDWTVDDYEENCSYCGQIYSYHKPNHALFCAKQIARNAIIRGGELH